MIKSELIIKLEPILSNKEIEVVLKRLNNKHITQTESNYLSRSIRPKLKSAEFAVSTQLLSQLDYRRRKYEREDRLLREKIIEVMDKYINQTKAIILFGSYVRNNHSNYRDIDVMVIFKKKLWKTSAQKYKLKNSLEKASSLNLQVHLLNYKDLMHLLPYSPLLQFQLLDHQVIYGKAHLPKEINISRQYLYSVLLETEFIREYGEKLESKYIYNAIRTCVAVSLFLNKKIDNNLLVKIIYQNIGKTTANALADNSAAKSQKKIGTAYFRHLYEKLEDDLKLVKKAG